MMEYWNNGMPKAGMMEYWNNRMMEDRDKKTAYSRQETE
jgi:hypothetical protein